MGGEWVGSWKLGSGVAQARPASAPLAPFAPPCTACTAAQLFFRMNEMDDMLNLVQQSAAAGVEVHSAQWRAAQADR